MKKILALIIITGLIAIAIVSKISGAVGTNAPPLLREYIVDTQPTNYLSASSIRVTFSEVALDPVDMKPVVMLLLEAWGTDVDNGVTNKTVIKSQRFTLTRAQLNAWLSAPNGGAFLKAALLAKVKLNEKP